MPYTGLSQPKDIVLFLIDFAKSNYQRTQQTITREVSSPFFTSYESVHVTVSHSYKIVIIIVLSRQVEQFTPDILTRHTESRNILNRYGASHDKFAVPHQPCFRWLSKNFDIQGAVIFQVRDNTYGMSSA
jgi:hypothetical protein